MEAGWARWPSDKSLFPLRISEHSEPPKQIIRAQLFTLQKDCSLYKRLRHRAPLRATPAVLSKLPSIYPEAERSPESPWKTSVLGEEASGERFNYLLSPDKRFRAKTLELGGGSFRHQLEGRQITQKLGGNSAPRDPLQAPACRALRSLPALWPHFPDDKVLAQGG